MLLSGTDRIYIILTLNEEEFFGLKKNPEADFLEIRLDQFSPEDGKAERILDKIKSLNANCVLTYRQPEDSSLSNKGVWTQENIQPLIRNLESGRHYIDLELDKDNSIFTSLEEKKFGIIRSVHNFSGIPGFEELDFYLRSVMEESHGTEKTKLPFQRVFKIAALPKFETDKRIFSESCLRISELCKNKTISLGFCGILMGEEGKEYRIFPEKIGSQFTYTCLGEAKAPGQVELKTLLKKRSER